MRILKKVEHHPYAAGAFGAQLVDEEKQGGASLLRWADDKTVNWALSYWPESHESDFEWGLGNMKVRHRESGEIYKIRIGHPVGGELESDVQTFVVRDRRLILLGKPGTERPKTTFLGTYMKTARKIEHAGPPVEGAGRREHLVTRRDALTVDLFRSSGRMLNRGVEVRPPALPRSTSGRSLLRLEAGRDRNVRAAYEAALAQAAKARQLKPQVLSRACGEILDIR